MSAAVYFKITSYEAGITNTGKRSANYHCYCTILDAEKKPIDHFFTDVFYGKWSKCKTVMNKWKKLCEKYLLSQTY